MTTSMTRTELEPSLNEGAIAELPDQRHLLYARGYLLTTDPSQPPATHWGTMALPYGHLHWDKRNALGSATNGVESVILIGRAIHVASATDDMRHIAGQLLARRAVERTAYLEELDWLAGRYVVIDCGPDGTRIQTDATGMRSAFYSNDGKVISSHGNLAAAAMGGAPQSPFGKGTWWATGAVTYPGNTTEWEGVSILTPNTELSVGTGAVTRVGPWPISAVLDPAEAARRVLPLMQTQFSVLSAASPLLISLTGGLDSRITLALSQHVSDNCTYFTFSRPYNTGNDSTEDLKAAKEICARLGLKHQEVHVVGNIDEGDLNDVMRLNSPRHHARSVAKAYREQLPPDQPHIRSNVYEIARCFYRALIHDAPDLDAAKMAQILVKKDFRGGLAAATEAFDDWTKTASFTEVPGYDSYDLFYWEHRMSSWLNAVYSESDIAHDTLTVVNCRAILRLLLSVPMEDRRQGTVFDHIVALAWPAVYDLPVNGQRREVPHLVRA